MFEVTEYYLVHDQIAESVTEKVNELIRLGWQPAGGVSMINGHYAQAMVKYGKKTGSKGKTQDEFFHD